MKTLNLPVGVLGTHHPGLFSVRIDDVAASRLAVNHLLDLGHRRITAAGAKQSAILNAEGQRQAQVLLAEGQAKAIGIVFSAIHDARPAPTCWRTSTDTSCPRSLKAMVACNIRRAGLSRRGRTSPASGDPQCPAPAARSSGSPERAS